MASTKFNTCKISLTDILTDEIRLTRPFFGAPIDNADKVLLCDFLNFDFIRFVFSVTTLEDTALVHF